MKERIFIDSNIYLYAFLEDKDLKNKQKSSLSRNLIQSLDENIELIISIQVINEIYVNLLKNKIPETIIRKNLDAVIEDAEMIVQIDLQLVKNAWNIREKYNFSYWDSMVVSSALLSDCKFLYSEDMQHGMKIEDSLQIQNPLV